MSNITPVNDKFSKIFDEICEERFGSIDLECLLVSIIDNVPSDALPHLASQYHILGNEGWLQAESEEEKREIIKKSIKIHRYKGTKYALKQILSALNIDGKITEWFEYGGEPYYFKIVLNAINKALEPKLEVQMIKLINEFKNERSWLETLETMLTLQGFVNYLNILIQDETILIASAD